MGNAEAQREKEKTILYARNIVIEAIQKTLPMLVNCAVRAYDEYTKHSSGDDVEVAVNFDEYTSPSFEATAETVAKVRPGKVIMSVRASVDKMYGNGKGEEWKAEEIKWLRIENGIMEIQEPVISESDDLGGKIPTPDDYPQDE